MTDSTWYFLDGETPVGPLQRADLSSLVRNGRIAAATSVRNGQDNAWSAAQASLPDLFDAPYAPSQRAGDWIDTTPHPWRRYFARSADTIVSASLIWFVIGILAYTTVPEGADQFFNAISSPGGRLIDVVLSSLFAIPINALLIGTTGLTLGKWIFGVRVLRDGKPIGVAAALQREFAVWFWGTGCGVPIVSMISQLTAKNHLQEHKRTSWDKDLKLIVTHRAESSAATMGMVAGVILLIVVIALLRAA